MKKGLYKRLAAAVLVLTTGALFTGCGFHTTFGFGTNYLDRADAKEFKIEKAVVDPITSITIRTGFAEVELIEADNFYVAIDYLYWEEEPEYSLEGGKLSFDDSHSFPDSYSINFNLLNTIKIYLPKASSLKDLNIKDSSGDVKVSSFIAEDMNITVSYGNFTMKEAAAAKADVTLSSGTSKISDCQLGELKFTNYYGNAKFTNINTGNALLPADVTYDSLGITMSSGDVDISSLNINSIDISNSYGDITCKGITAEEFDAELSSGSLEVDDADLQHIDVNNSYGDVTLRLAGPDTEYSLDLNTSYGEITVDDKDYDEHLVVDNNGTRNVTADLSSGDVKVTFK